MENKTVEDIIEDIQAAQIEAGGRFLRQFEIRKMTVDELLNLLIPNNISFTIKFKKQVNDFNNKTKKNKMKKQEKIIEELLVELKYELMSSRIDVNLFKNQNKQTWIKISKNLTKKEVDFLKSELNTEGMAEAFRHILYFLNEKGVEIKKFIPIRLIYVV